jgi:hypothetical protein
MKLSTTHDSPSSNDVFADINRLFRSYQRGLLSEYETMVMIAASATQSIREHTIEVAKENSPSYDFSK